MTLRYSVAELGLYKSQQLRYRYARAAVLRGLAPIKSLTDDQCRRLLPYCDRRWLLKGPYEPRMRTLLRKRWFALMAAAVLAGGEPAGFLPG